MKKITLLAALLVAGITTANAQINVETPKLSANVGTTPIKKGNWMVGASVGNIGYNFEAESFSFMVKPTAAYFISDGFAVGAEIGGGIKTGVEIKGADGKINEKTQWDYVVMPFVRYYFPEGASATGRFFGQGGLGISGSQVGSTNENSFAFSLNGGYSHFVSRNVALEAIVGYNYSKANTSEGKKFSGLGVGVGFQIFLGKN
ncbi:outer membrane beta-barrel protein [Myroides marinus]|jgi:hypothetical protein|uniref:Outer membrane protein beta-barrel domain-containing protein n=1 Tax=Myroides marinus TaxID=703342 RepID=A0A164ATU1_9FLAO|nr:outer membrane beta-barrel protein [Myroides marinus]KZE84875.1 hypothetical protein AV926_02565 [Myroides marinus]MDM1348806.1 outer membrane beta-barrel protein [Myroides marinus]MDM1354970.1 outer membrane beta-barrel protein [Myroides marinus]MDM1361747.1 outer membrane beta-barrel protein [Myroides marinus]MDM1364332.1 outer membrane beta-barrel protein [Myroides marinus]